MNEQSILIEYFSQYKNELKIDGDIELVKYINNSYYDKHELKFHLLVKHDNGKIEEIVVPTITYTLTKNKKYLFKSENGYSTQHKIFYNIEDILVLIE
jgi:hypothetical protein